MVKLTGFAIIMTGLCGFLTGVLLSGFKFKNKKEPPKHYVKNTKSVSVEYLSPEYKNFLDYDGSEQA